MVATRVVLLGLDGFPPEAISPELTPRLWALGEQGGHHAAGGRCALPSTTYPGFSTLLTGQLPARHGVRATITSGPRPGVIPGWAGLRRVQAPTVFDACRAGGVRSVAILGDHMLYGLLGVETADLVWPPQGAVPPGTPLESHGYPSNEAVRPHLVGAVADGSVAFLFGHLNEADSVGHDVGPQQPEAWACYAATDAIIGAVIEALRPDWEQSVVMVVSDHGMEPFTDQPPIDLLADRRAREVAADSLHQGGAALVRLRPGVSAPDACAALAAVPGIARCGEGGDEFVLVEAEPGRAFASAPPRLPGGHHGGPGAARTLAVVGGGHPAVAAIGAAVRAHPPHLADWAPTIAGLLGLDLPGCDGRDLAAR